MVSVNTTDSTSMCTSIVVHICPKGDTEDKYVSNVPVKSKLKHPPRDLTPLPACVGGHLITTHRGWEISISCY